MLDATIDGLFLAAARRWPERPFARFSGPGGQTQVSYGDAARRIAAELRALRDAGVRPGDRLGCYAEATDECLWLMLAGAFAGAVLVPLGPRHSVQALARLLERVDGHRVFTTPARAAAVRALGAQVLVHGDADGCASLPTVGDQPLDAALALLADASAGHTPSDRYIIISTSGTTSEPKLVVRAHRAFASLAPHMALGLEPGAEPQERVLMASSLTHGIGQANLAFGLYLGAELACPAHIEAQVRLDEVRACDPSYVYSNPRVTNALAQQFSAERDAGGAAATVFGPSLRVLRLGGGPSTPAARQIFADQGVDVGEIYASSECGSIAMTPRGDRRMRILPDVTVKLGADQELLVRTERGMDGYHGDPEATRAAYTDDGFFQSGDRVAIEDGYLRFLSRKNDAFNTPDGDNINPVWIEGLLEALPWVDQVVLIGDRLPFITALIAVAGAPSAAEGDGYLDPTAHAELYQQARRDLEAINGKLEAMERIRDLALFGRRFPDDMYRVGAAGKTRRVRDRIAARYAGRIEAMYAAARSARRS